MGLADPVRQSAFNKFTAIEGILDTLGTEQAAQDAILSALFTSGAGLVFSTWVPVWEANGSMTFTAVTTNRASYVQIGKLVLYQVSGTGTIGGTVNNGVRFSLPVASVSSSSNFTIGQGYANDAATTSLAAFSYLNSTTKADISFYDFRNFTAGAGCIVSSSGFYEAA